MMKHNLIIIFVLVATTIYPATSISRWFSSSYADLTTTLYRYGHCVGSLSPLKESNMNETEYLINQMKTFLNEANLDSDQLSNVTVLMDNLCRPEPNANYPISVHVDVKLYSSTQNGKQNRCKAIGEAMDAMYYVFKRASQNKSEPLDFSVIQYYPNATNTEASYNLTDLINTSWIKSDIQVEHICKITDGIKEFIQTRSANQTAQERLEKPSRTFETIMDMIDHILEPLLGFQKRLYWESNNRFEILYINVGNQLGNLGASLASGYNSYKQFLANTFRSSNRTTMTQPTNQTSIKVMTINQTTPNMVNSTTIGNIA